MVVEGKGTMKYTQLGHSGLQVSDLCMGVMTFGRETAKADSFTMLDMFLDVGGNFIDTANGWPVSGGMSW